MRSSSAPGRSERRRWRLRPGSRAPTQSPNPVCFRSSTPAAAIPLAERLGATLLCDDADGRNEARKRGLPVVGTLGVLLRGKREGHLTEIAPAVARMTALGMFVAPALLAQVLMLAEEAPAGPDRT